jgi:NADP-dependent 3-hydroxy acid dehydrogenase YdfG/aryl carrier-like protein
MDSRSLEFADDVLAATEGEGVDVILNSLAGEAISRGMSVLRPNGRFLEIGKRDIYQDTPIGLKPFRKELSFHSIDLDRMIRQRPSALGALFRQLASEFAEGRLHSIPYRVFQANEIINAFRFMQSGRHIGKVVVSMLDRPAEIVSRPAPSFRLKPDRSYLITGGLGGFGSMCARWMADHGARHLVLMGRRGATSAEAQGLLDDLKSRGVTVTVITGDVSQPDDVTRVLRSIDDSSPPLGGVLHAAMVLEDGLLTNLDQGRMERVLAPKIHGAWNLHRATLDRPIDFFLMFSSLSSVIGHAGQGNYAAANAFLDQLAHYRRGLGLPATTINWGYVGDVGVVARNERLGERLESQGVGAIPIQEALRSLGVILQHHPTQIGVMRMDWARWRQSSAMGQVPRRFVELCRESHSAEVNAANITASVRQQLLSVSADQRLDVLIGVLREKLARVLGAAVSQIDPHQPLLSLGIDSLMAVDLRNWIEQELRCLVPVVELIGSSGLAALAETLMTQFSAEAPEASSDIAASIPAGTSATANGTPEKRTNGQPPLTADAVNQLNDEEVDRLLAELLPSDKPH